MENTHHWIWARTHIAFKILPSSYIEKKKKVENHIWISCLWLHLLCREGAFFPKSWVHLSGETTAALSFPSAWVYSARKQECVGKLHLLRPYRDRFHINKAPTANSYEGFLIALFRYMEPNLILFTLSFSSALERPESGPAKPPAAHLDS